MINRIGIVTGLFLFMFIFFQMSVVCADEYNFDSIFSLSFNYSSFDNARSFQQTTDGGFILSGSTTVSGDSDILLIKTNSTGSVEWNQTYNFSSGDISHSIVRLSDAYFIGGAKNVGGPNLNAILIKTNSTGSVEWNQTYNFSIVEGDLISMTNTSDGGFVIGATSLGDYLLIKTNSTGSVEWNMSYDSGGSDKFKHVIQTNDSGYLLTGYDSNGMTNVWTIKTNSTGSVEWNMSYDSGGLDFGARVMELEDGSFAITATGGNDFWLIKTNSTGSVEWNQSWGGSGSDEPRSFLKTSDNGYLIAGETFSFGVGNQYDGWVVKTNETGSIEWNKTYGLANVPDYIYDIKELSPDTYIFCGALYNNSGDAWLLKFNVTYSDTTNPQIEYLSLSDNLAVYSASNFLYLNVTDSLNLSNITFTINYSNGSIFYQTTINFSGTYNESNISFNLTDYGNYTWDVLVYDLAGNYNRSDNFTLSYVLPSSPVVAGSTSSSSTTSRWARIIKVNDSSLNLGQTLKELKKNYRITFNVNGLGHSISIINLTNNNITFIVESTPQTATLSINESKIFDVDGDGIYDLLVRLLSISSKGSEIDLKEINGPSDNSSDSGESNSNDLTSSFDRKNYDYLYWIFIVVFLIAAFCLILFKKKKSKR